MKWLLVVVAVVSAGSAHAGSDQATGVVTGVVVDEAGAPLARATVAVVGTTRGDRTDREGRFTITGVPAGRRLVRAVSEGYQEGKRRVEVAAGDTSRTGFLLATGPARMPTWLIAPVRERVALGGEARVVTRP